MDEFRGSAPTSPGHTTLLLESPGALVASKTQTCPVFPSLQVGGCFIYEVLGGELLGISISLAVEFIGLRCLFMKLRLSCVSSAS